MLTRLLTGVLFCIAAHASAQITGTVSDSKTLKAIGNVNILYNYSNISLAATDSTGSFRIDNLKPGTLFVFKHLFYKRDTIKSYDSIAMRVFLRPCCESISEAQEMFREYCSHKLKYPAKLRKKQIGGEVLIRFSMDSALNVSNVSMLKDIDGMYAETARQFMLTLPVEVKKMLRYLNATEFLLPVVFTFEKNLPSYTAPDVTDVTVLKPVILRIYNVVKTE